MALKIVYVICVAVTEMFLIGGGAWLTYSGGSIWWVIVGLVLASGTSYGFTKRVNSWGDLGKVD